MNKLITCIFLLAIAVGDIHGQTQTQPTSTASGKRRASTSFTEKLLKFFGISDSPSTLKGPGDEVRKRRTLAGDLERQNHSGLDLQRWLPLSGFPVGNKDVLALRGK